MQENITWQQRFANFKNALDKLSEAVDYFETSAFDEEAAMLSYNEVAIEAILKEGLIGRFESTHELAWNVMRDYAQDQGSALIAGRREATHEGLSHQLISDGVLWMDMISSRIKVSQTYDKTVEKAINTRIIVEYYIAFLDFRDVMNKKLRD